MGGTRIGPHGEGDFWSPVSDRPNQWVQLGVWGHCPSTGSGKRKCTSFGQTKQTQMFQGAHKGQQNTCLGHHEVNNGANKDPGWGIDGKRHPFMKYILCCPRGTTAQRFQAGTCSKRGYINQQIDVTSVDHEKSGIMGQYFNFKMSELPGLRCDGLACCCEIALASVARGGARRLGPACARARTCYMYLRRHSPRTHGGAHDGAV